MAATRPTDLESGGSQTREGELSTFAVIVQNDESRWDDVKGDLYHYPSRYQKFLEPGTKAIYYKGRMTNVIYAQSRLSPDPHYFGVATIGDSIVDPDAPQNRYCEILEYREFEEAVPIRSQGVYLEEIPASRATNYWRDGVRSITETVYARIAAEARLGGYSPKLPSARDELESFGPLDGGHKARYSSYYERNPFYRTRALELHGYACMVCAFDFERHYGALGKGFIHVHHNKPLSVSGPTRINPQTDLSVVCPNCHSMLHKKKDTTLTVEELRNIIAST
jgi:putative restriction endonuclease